MENDTLMVMLVLIQMLVDTLRVMLMLMYMAA